MNKLLLLSFFISVNVFSVDCFKLNSTNPFIENDIFRNDSKVKWYYLEVPQNWEDSTKGNIQLATVFIESLKANSKNETIIYIQGGPGGPTIQNIKRWYNHPLRSIVNIVLVDLRGTGFSTPRLDSKLGRDLFNIMSCNLTSQESLQLKKQKVIKSKNEMIERGIDLTAYNSHFCSKDIDALRKALNIKSWHVYGASYGTYIAQMYSSIYPCNIKSLILDSPIVDITNYYNQISIGYNESINNFFNAYEKDSICKYLYPDLKIKYEKVIKNLRDNPLPVPMKREQCSTGMFVFNDDDFLLLMQQSLYNKETIRIIPLIINLFYDRNIAPISNIINSFSRTLEIDFGTYYSFICNEVIPFTKQLEVHEPYHKINFYDSDFCLCDEWNITGENAFDLQYTDSIPVLIFSGEFDPITKPEYGDTLAKKYENSKLVFAPTYGHAPTFSKQGNEIVYSFIKNGTNLDNELLTFEEKAVSFLPSIMLNQGVVNLSSYLSMKHWILFIPIILNIIFSISFITFFIKRIKINSVLDYLLVICNLLSLTIIISISYGINDTIENSYLILGFGLLHKYTFVLPLCYLFLIVLFSCLLLYLMKNKRVKYVIYYLLIIFSNLTLAFYLLYFNII